MRQITIDEARNQQAGTFLGLLHMAYTKWEKNGKLKDQPQPEQSLSTAQYHALLTCQEAHNDFLKAIGAPGAMYDGYNGNSGDPEAHEKWARTAKKRWQGVEEAIKEAQQCDRSSNLWAALDHGVKREAHVPYMLGSIKALANVLNRHFTKGKKKR